jgi:hypothetical protein
MQFLSENIGLIRKENFSPFNLAQVEQHFRHLLDGPAELIAVGVLGKEIAERLGFVDNPSKELFFLCLEWQVWNFVLPALEIF